jgi:hypothetical protein
MAHSKFFSAWRFFLENAGYCTPPGRAAFALALAHAERWAQENDLTFTWEPDFDPDLSWMSEGERAKEHVSEGCVCRDAEGHVLTSLWGIVDADQKYRRVVEGELASEAHHQATGSFVI